MASLRLLPILTAVLEEEGGEPWLNHLQVRMGALFEKTTSHPGSLHSFGIFDISGESLTSAPGSQCVWDLLLLTYLFKGGRGVDEHLISSRLIVLDFHHVPRYNLNLFCFQVLPILSCTLVHQYLPYCASQNKYVLQCQTYVLNCGLLLHSRLDNWFASSGGLQMDVDNSLT